MLVCVMALALAFSACGGGKGGDTAAAPPDNGETEAAEPAATEPAPELVAEEGRFMGKDNTMSNDTITINSEWIPFQEAQKLTDWGPSMFAATGDFVYVLSSVFIQDDGEAVPESIVKEFKLTGGVLVYQGDMPIEGFTSITADDNGVLYSSDFWGYLVGYKDGIELFSEKVATSRTVMDPSGKTGFSWHSGNEAKVITMEGGIPEAAEDVQTYPEILNISSINFGKNHVMVSGGSSNEEKNGHLVTVYDRNGNHEFIFGDAEFGEPGNIGFAKAVVETSNGFLVLDGNFHEIHTFEPDGSFIGSIKSEDLLGANRAWFDSARLMPDGSILIGMSQERADKSCYEYLIYRLTGF